MSETPDPEDILTEEDDLRPDPDERPTEADIGDVLDSTVVVEDDENDEDRDD